MPRSRNFQNDVHPYLSSKASKSHAGFESVRTGTDFEHFVCSEINKIGWRAKTTGKSGDQGCDVIAKKGANTIVVQCKFHKKPVGNKAVQEVFAAKAHYNASHALVISSSGYTKDARAIAKTTGVILGNQLQIGSLLRNIQNQSDWRRG